MAMSDERVPMPGERHPCYAGSRYDFVAGWLDDHRDGSFTLNVPVTPPVSLAATTELNSASVMHFMMLTRHEAGGLAPYVGRPFVYVWHVGVDQFGRSVAGEAKLTYYDEDSR